MNTISAFKNENNKNGDQIQLTSNDVKHFLEPLRDVNLGVCFNLVCLQA